MEIDRKRKIGTLKTKDSKERRKSLSSCGDTEFIEENIGKLEWSICSLLIGGKEINFCNFKIIFVLWVLFYFIYFNENILQITNSVILVLWRTKNCIFSNKLYIIFN